MQPFLTLKKIFQTLFNSIINSEFLCINLYYFTEKNRKNYVEYTVQFQSWISRRASNKTLKDSLFSSMTVLEVQVS